LTLKIERHGNMNLDSLDFRPEGTPSPAPRVHKPAAR